MVRTPPRRNHDITAKLVTPTTTSKSRGGQIKVGSVQKQLFHGPKVVTPSRRDGDKKPAAKKRLIFGKYVEQNPVQGNVRLVYATVSKLTGSLGGNGSHGPIYGELTMSSMQKMVNLMKKHTNFDKSSRFIDVGSGIGKPNLHVMQDPGVEFSYGIEVEYDRWILGMTCLRGALGAGLAQSYHGCLKEDEKLHHRCYFEHADIRDAKTFDPFTHVYMFSIGFPPSLWLSLADMWNRSDSMYLICFHSPKDIIQSYEFKVELVAQTPTSMHGSKEGHMGYIYKRVTAPKTNRTRWDPLYSPAYDLICKGLEPLYEKISSSLDANISSGPSTRTRKRRMVTP